MTFAEAIKVLREKFTSGNEIPVERTVITRDEFLAIELELARLQFGQIVSREETQ